ncbi:phage tail protein [Streptococcus orisratti]
MDLTSQFDKMRITNGKWRKQGKSALEAVTKLGCTGSLSVEAKTKTITKTCEGKVAKEKTIITKLNGTFTGHFPVGVLRDVMGLSNKKLKEGVYGINETSSGASGVITFEVFDMEEAEKKNIAFPNITWGSVNIIDITNGEEEIAEIEAPFSALFDENGYCYYEGFDSDIKDDSVKTGWNNTFTPELVRSASL